MKKLSQFFSLCLILLFPFISCTNFMNGADFMERLQDVIDYNSKDYVSVKIDAPNSCTESVIPTAGVHAGEYKKGDTFDITFIPSDGYYFTSWKVTPDDAVTFDDPLAAETSVTINLECAIVIEPVCGKRAQVVASTPAYEKTGVNRAIDIRILFDQDMSESSIYWTEDELNEIKNEFSGFSFEYSYYAVPGKKDANNNQYYYAYTVTTSEGKKRYFKNIDIHKRNTTESLLNIAYYDMPYFETPSILVIPVAKEDHSYRLPALTDIEVVIEKGFVNSNGIEIAREYTCCYRTNGGYDNVGPSFYWGQNHNDNRIYALKGIQPYTKLPWKLIDDNPKTIAPTEQEIYFGLYYDQRTLVEDEMRTALLSIDSFETLKNEYKILDTKTVIVDGNFTVEDESGIAEIVLTLTPVPNKFYKHQSSEKYSVSNTYSGQKELVFGSSNLLKFDLSELDTEGIYKLSISVADVVGNSSEVPFYANVNTTKYCVGYPPETGDFSQSIGVYCIVDNIFDADFNYTATKNSTSGRYDITGSVGRYYIFVGAEDVTLWTTYFLREGYAEKLSSNYIRTITNINDCVSFPGFSNVQGLPCLMVEDLFGNLRAELLPLY